MPLWQVDLVDAGGDPLQGIVLAPASDAASEAVLAEWRKHREPETESPRVRAVRRLDWAARVLDLDMSDERLSALGPHRDEPKVWKVPYDDGLFQRSAGAALVIADSAEAARRIVIEADPWEGRPFYGVPGVFGEAEPFVPEVYVLWIDLTPEYEGPPDAPGGPGEASG